MTVPRLQSFSHGLHTRPLLLSFAEENCEDFDTQSYVSSPPQSWKESNALAKQLQALGFAFHPLFPSPALLSDNSNFDSGCTVGKCFQIYLHETT
jgi:hypothetical protein